MNYVFLILAMLFCAQAQGNAGDQGSCEQAQKFSKADIAPPQPQTTNQSVSVQCGASCCVQKPLAKASDADGEGAAFAWDKLIEAIAKLASALAWPLAGAYIALKFKQELATLLARLKKGKLGSAEFEFENAVQEAEAAAEIPRTVSAESAVQVSGEILNRDPRGVVVAAWIDVENALFNLVQSRSIAVPVSSAPYRPIRSLAQAIRTVEKLEILDRKYISLFNDLRAMRNDAAHAVDFSPSQEALIKYVQLARELAGVMQATATAG